MSRSGHGRTASFSVLRRQDSPPMYRWEAPEAAALRARRDNLFSWVRTAPSDVLPLNPEVLFPLQPRLVMKYPPAVKVLEIGRFLGTKGIKSSTAIRQGLCIARAGLSTGCGSAQAKKFVIAPSTRIRCCRGRSETGSLDQMCFWEGSWRNDCAGGRESDTSNT